MKKKLNLEPIVLDSAAPIEVLVTHLDKTYVLCEADEGTAVEYQDQLIAGTKFNDDGKPVGVVGISGLEPWLVSKCLFEIYTVNENGNQVEKRRPVPLRVINSWRPAAVKALHARAMHISRLDKASKEDGDELKNSLDGTETTSD